MMKLIKMNLKRLLALALAMTTILAFSACAQENTWEAPCFDGPYDYAYADDQRSISIRKFMAINPRALQWMCRFGMLPVCTPDLHRGISNRCPRWRSAKARCWRSTPMIIGRTSTA